MMICEQYNTFKIKKTISDGKISMVLELDDGRYFKAISRDFIDYYKKNGMSIEDKILASEEIKGIPEIVLPSTAVYIGDRFCGYTLEKVEGLSYPEYVKNFKTKDVLDLEKLTKIYCNIENVVKKGWEQDLVFPDLLNGRNVIFDKDDNVKLIDFDGIQYKNYVADTVSFVLSDMVKNPKFFDRGLWTREMDKKSLMYIYFSVVYGVGLSRVGSVFRGEAITMQSVYDTIALEDDRICEKVNATMSDNHEGFLIGKDACRIAQEYRLVPSYYKGEIVKKLSKIN